MKDPYPPYTDGVAIKVIFDQHMRRSAKNNELITVGDARKLALKVVYYFAERHAYRLECANGAPTDAPIATNKVAD